MSRVLVFLALLGLAQPWANAQRPDGVPGQGFGQGQGQDQGQGQGLGQVGAQGRGAVIPGQYIVVFKETGEPVEAVAERVRGQRPDAIEVFQQYDVALRGCAIRLRNTPDLPDEAARSALINSIQANLADSIEYVEPDQVVTTSQTSSLNGGVNRIRGSVATSYNSAAMSLGAAKVGIAVIDTGVANHPDLTVATGSNEGFCASGLLRDCSGSGRGTQTYDCNGHGTHCSGIAAGRNTGVAPGTKIYPVKVLNKRGSGTNTDVTAGLEWVLSNWQKVSPPIRVVSMSLGGGASTAIDTAVNNLANAGVVVVVAAGNDNADLATSSPAGASGVIAVTAVTMQNSNGSPAPSGDVAASYSNWASGTQSKVVAAPGTNIYSTWRNGGYNTISGTSMATPHVAGMVARCFGFSYTCSGVAKSTTGNCEANPSGARSTFLGIVSGAVGKYNGVDEGFTGDPAHPITGRYYGWMGFAPNVDVSPAACP